MSPSPAPTVEFDRAHIFRPLLTRQKVEIFIALRFGGGKINADLMEVAFLHDLSPPRSLLLAMKHPAGRLLSLLFFCLIAIGCGSPEPAGIAVSGLVEFEGKPLDQGSIEFSPAAEQDTFSGASIVDGRYEIPAERGLAPGMYDVRISSTEGGAAVEGPPGESPITAKQRIPAKFNTATTLKADIKDDGEQTFDFKIP